MCQALCLVLYVPFVFQPCSNPRGWHHPHFIDEETKAQGEGKAGEKPQNWDHPRARAGWAPGTSNRLSCQVPRWGWSWLDDRVVHLGYATRLVWVPSCSSPGEAGLLFSPGVY